MTNTANVYVFMLSLCFHFPPVLPIFFFHRLNHAAAMSESIEFPPSVCIMMFFSFDMCWIECVCVCVSRVSCHAANHCCQTRKTTPLHLSPLPHHSGEEAADQHQLPMTSSFTCWKMVPMHNLKGMEKENAANHSIFCNSFSSFFLLILN